MHVCVCGKVLQKQLMEDKKNCHGFIQLLKVPRIHLYAKINFVFHLLEWKQNMKHTQGDKRNNA